MLTQDELIALVDGMDVIEARNALYLLKAADFPYLKQSDRRKVHKQIYTCANPQLERKSVTFEELQAILSGRSA